LSILIHYVVFQNTLLVRWEATGFYRSFLENADYVDNVIDDNGDNSDKILVIDNGSGEV